jgi:hypothetical protein
LLGYLAAWSSHNALAIEATSRFYGSQVRFYGRRISVDMLVAEKKRFVQQWPIRDYKPKAGSISVSCGREDTCRVTSLVTYRATNPVTGRRAAGTAPLALQISYTSGRPEIVAEGDKLGPTP